MKHILLLTALVALVGCTKAETPVVEEPAKVETTSAPEQSAEPATSETSSAEATTSTVEPVASETEKK